MGSGAARGLAHIGVIKVLEREGVPIDMIAGTSAGAAIGALYALRRDISEIEKLALEVDWKALASPMDLTFPWTGFIKGRKIEELLRTHLDDALFSDLRIPFACVATDIETGEEVIIREGSVVEAVRASISVPVLFTPVRWENRILVDGGLVDPVPVRALKEMGADFIIAVNVGLDTREKMQKLDQENYRPPHIFKIIMQMLHISSYRITAASLEGADLVIEPKLGHLSHYDFSRAAEFISQGEEAARRALSFLLK